MKRNIFGLFASAGYIVLILLSAKFFENEEKESSRKYIHIMLSNWWIIAMIFFDSPVFACIGPAIFVVLNYISYKYDLIKTMEREKKDGLGTVYYALTLLILSYLTFGPLDNTLIGLCGVIIMGYADGMAAVMGKSIESFRYKIFGTTKSLAGSLTMFIISFIIISGFLVYVNVAYWFIKAIIISIVLTVLEAISVKGTDNLTVPLAAVAMLFLV